MVQLDFSSRVSRSTCDYTLNSSPRSFVQHQIYSGCADGISKAQLLLEYGILNWRRGDLSRAEQMLIQAQEIIQEYHGDLLSSQCYTGMALVKTSLGKTEEAIAAYQNAIALVPEKFHLWNNLGTLYLRLNDREQALDAFKQALKSNPKDPIAWIGLANTYDQDNNFDYAIKSYKQALGLLQETDLAYPSINQGSPEVKKYIAHQWLRLAILYTNKNHYKQAIDAFQKMLSCNPENAEILNEIGTLYTRVGANEESINFLSKVTNSNSGHGDPYLNLASDHTRLRKHDESTPYYMKAIEKIFEHREMELASQVMDEVKQIVQKNDLFTTYKKNDEASLVASFQDPANLFYFKYNEDITLTNLSSHVRRGKTILKNRAKNFRKRNFSRRVAYNNARKHQTGGKKMKNIFSIRLAKPFTATSEVHTADLNTAFNDSSNPLVWNEKGNIHFKNQDYENAIASYHKAIQLDPAFGHPYSNLALIHFIQGEYRQAIKLYHKSISLLSVDREKAIAWNFLGNIYRCIKDYESARAAYQNASKFDRINGGVYDNATLLEISEKSKTAEFWNDLGKLFFKTCDYEKAVSAFIKAIRLDPSSGYSYSYLARVRTTEGRYKEAISLYHKSVDLFTDDKAKATIWNRLGDVHRKLNDYDRAFEAYQNAMMLTNDRYSLLRRTRLSLLGNCATKH